MERNAVLADLLAKLQSRIRHHQEQEAHHAERESFHRDQRARHAAELEALTRHAEALQAAAEAVEGLPPAEPEAWAPQPASLAYGRGRRTPIMPAVKKVVEAKAPGEPFDARAVTAEVNRRFASHFRRAVDERQVSNCLRRLARHGRIVASGEGRPHHGAQYTRS